MLSHIQVFVDAALLRLVAHKTMQLVVLKLILAQSEFAIDDNLASHGPFSAKDRGQESSRATVTKDDESLISFHCEWDSFDVEDSETILSDDHDFIIRNLALDLVLTKLLEALEVVNNHNFVFDSTWVLRKVLKQLADSFLFFVDLSDVVCCLLLCQWLDSERLSVTQDYKIDDKPDWSGYKK